MLNTRALLLWVIYFYSPLATSQINFTANDFIPPYEKYFGFGINPGMHAGWTDEALANIAAGNKDLEIEGIGVTSFRPMLPEYFLENWGYDIREATFQHYADIGMGDNVVFIGFPSVAHRETTYYCPNEQSHLFANLYESIWDNGENDTPVNDENYYALYVYKMVKTYKDQVSFWEVWNEPDFSYTVHSIEAPGTPGNWWEYNPEPCDYVLKAPIMHYIRLLRITYEVVKFIDPEAYVTTGGLGYPSFLDAILRNTDNPLDGSVTDLYPYKGGAYFDVLSYHSYPHFDNSLQYWDNELNGFAYTRHSDAAVDGMLQLQEDFREVLENHGYDGEEFPSKLWIITESNLPRKSFQNYIGSDEAQRNYLIKAVVACMQNDILQFHPFALADQQLEEDAYNEFSIMGLYKKIAWESLENIQKNDGGVAYKTVSHFLADKFYDPERTLEMALPENVRGGAFRDSSDHFIYVLWAKTSLDNFETAIATYQFPEAWIIPNLKIHDWAFSEHGFNTVLSNQEILLTGAPQFISIENELEVLDLQINTFPNPFSNELHITFKLEEGKSFRTSILNELGIEILELLPKNTLEKGEHQLAFNISSLKAGLYFLKSDIGDRSVVNKIVKIEESQVGY